jgi:hypothetical protein
MRIFVALLAIEIGFSATEESQAPSWSSGLANVKILRASTEWQERLVLIKCDVEDAGLSNRPRPRVHSRGPIHAATDILYAAFSLLFKRLKYHQGTSPDGLLLLWP